MTHVHAWKYRQTVKPGRTTTLVERRCKCGAVQWYGIGEKEWSKPQAPKVAEKPHKPHPCSNPKLDHDCSGCTDRDSEGTHQGCTRQHGHVGCSLAKSAGWPTKNGKLV